MALEARAISFRYPGSRPILRQVSAVFHPGRLTAIIGPNGSGKTTLLRLLLGLRRPVSGEVLLDGRPVADLPRPGRAARLAYIPQTSSVAFPFTVRHIVQTGRFAIGSGPGSRHAAEAALESLELADLADEPFGLLSAGQQQRVTVARALAQLDGPETASRALIADEPVSAMDPRHALRTLSILRDRARAGLAVIAVLHDLSAVLACADDVLMLSGPGTVLGAGPAADALTPASLELLYGVPFNAVGGGPGRPGALIPVAATTLTAGG